MVAEPKATKNNAFSLLGEKAFIMPTLHHQCHIALSYRQHSTDL
jgi:hypothetical protein